MFTNATTGESIYRRRGENLSGYIFLGGAMAVDPGTGDVHVVWADNFGNLYDFSKGTDRGRLQFETYTPSIAVEFGPALSLSVDLGPFLSNTGCDNVTLGILGIDDAASGIDIPAFAHVVDEDLLQKSSSIADDLTANSKFVPVLYTEEFDANGEMIVTRSERDYINPSATAFPTFINGLVTPYDNQAIAAGEVVNLVVDVIQANILRGPQIFYITVPSDDQDFFVDDPAKVPEAQVTLVGGCLIDFTEMYFGIAEANLQLVTNTGRIGEGDWDPHGFDIDGVDAAVFQGTYEYGVSQHSIAMSVSSWQSGETFASSWTSMQADPNWCDNECVPALTTGVALGAMWDGASYAPLTGNTVCATYLDSVINYDDGGGWNWRNFGSPFDNALTMGIMVNTKTIGVVDEPLMANMTLEKMTFTERNGNPVPDWRFGMIMDYDVSGQDSSFIDRDNSVIWATHAAGGAATDESWGIIKLPFGACDGEPIITSYHLDANEGQFESTAGNGNPYWDSLYHYLTLPAGGAQGQTSTGQADGELHATIAAHDFVGGDSYTIAVAQFGLSGLTNPEDGASYAALATLLNQWVGFGRGDVNGDGNTGDLSDILYLAAFVNNGGVGPIPFEHLGDVNCDGVVDALDITVLMDYYFGNCACPCGAWTL
jgi:hypothetical protein